MTKSSKDKEPELLRRLLRYEPETGKLFWRERPVEMFAPGKMTAEARFGFHANHGRRA